MKLRVGLVGLGTAWEVRHRPALRALSDRFEVRAICEPVAHRAEIAAREFSATPVDGFRALAIVREAAPFIAATWRATCCIVAWVSGEASKGKANPAQVNEILRRKLGT